MTDNEKLIEEARVAFTEAWDAEDRRIENWDRDARGTHSRSRAGIRAALAVFQKAHTPTDDEREALRAEAEEVQRAAWAEIHGQDPTRTYSVAEVKQLVYAFDNVLSSALRRTEVPESSVDEKIEWPDHWTVNEKLRDLHARWHDQKGNLLGREACGWEGCEFWDSAQFILRLADVHIAGREPQGEPSDAQVEAGCAAFYEGAQGLTSWPRLVAAEPDLANRYRDGLRAALRAAGGAR